MPIDVSWPPLPPAAVAPNPVIVTARRLCQPVQLRLRSRPAELIFVNVGSPEILQFIQGNSAPPTAPRDSDSGVTQISWPDSQLYVGETVSCSSTGWTQPATLA